MHKIMLDMFIDKLCWHNAKNNCPTFEVDNVSSCGPIQCCTRSAACQEHLGLNIKTAMNECDAPDLSKM